MPEIVEPEMLRSGVLEDALVQRGHGVWVVVHGPGPGGGEEPGVAWMPGVLLHEQVHRLLWDGDLPDGVPCFGAGDHECACVIFHSLFAEGDSPLLRVRIFPPQGRIWLDAPPHPLL